MAFDLRKKDTNIMPLKINGQIIEELSTCKYLRATIDEKLYKCDHLIKNKIISIWRYAKHTLSCFPKKSKSNSIQEYNHNMRKSEKNVYFIFCQLPLDT